MGEGVGAMVVALGGCGGGWKMGRGYCPGLCPTVVVYM